MLLAICLLGVNLPDLSYGCKQNLSAAQCVTVENALKSGWTEFARITKIRQPMPRIYQTTYDLAHVAVINEETLIGAAALFEETGSFLFIFYPKFSTLSDLNQSHIVVHELMHMYYNLPDHHRGLLSGNHPECVMDNFFVNGWSGNLCVSCRKGVK